ncbi:type IV-A pilus assembly ATPase PilB [Sulfidibacter corallicola]|uniref:Type IV-A pilus assembly ATPase PilB n=1 Tax=Sulfidibacter corallicola TaxID=2818388 RepID=A0A8A4TTL4_SULCO|nr:type IV-A pilus assembly ATPase PilB [Sulfidibacter corallicola]QTD52870.1 type IV-A pilus assembly ATPase PilB [Sulfidibacter corallicola]
MSQEIIPVVSLADREIDSELISLIPIKVLKKHTVVPISRRGSTITVATSDPTNIFAADELKFITGYNIEMVVARKEEIEQLLGVVRLGGDDILEGISDDHAMTAVEDGDGSIDFAADSMMELEDFDSLVSGAVDEIEVVEDVDEEQLSANVDAPIIKLVNSILLKAITMKVSDIHIEPYEKQMRVRYRLDGVLKNVMTLPVQLKMPVLSRVKVMAHLDIAERRLPQDGRIKLKIGRGREMDFRVSSLPTLFGEKIVLRLLDKTNLQLDMTKLGFDPEALDIFRDAISQPWGMVLVTGPTGSGKTTTLYSALSELNNEDTNIMTAEDPVEYNLLGINQVQMADNIGLNFAAALRSFLRQDPDVILVGEIRDFETAEISIKAALTGHLVLSTLHTNDAPSTVNRLINMGIEPFLVSSSVNLILAQRLARKVCQKCLTPAETSAAVLEQLGMTAEQIRNTKIMKGAGCPVCSGTGAKGRIALYEVMSLSAEIKEAIVMGASSTEIREVAMEQGMDTLRMAGVKKMMEGMVSVEEILRVTKGD